MKKIPAKKLTKEYLKGYADSQIAKYLNVGPVDEELAEQHIYKAYEVAKLAAPKNVIWYDSPESFVKSVGASVRASVRDSVGASVGASVRASVRDSVWDSVWDSVRASVRASVWDSVGASVGAWNNSAYDSWLKFFNDEMEKNDFEHICLFDEMVNGYLLTAETVHVVRKPIFLARNEQGRLHNDYRAAIEWADGYKFYYLQGIEFDEKTWRKVVEQKVDLTDLGSITNADQRAVAVQMLRPDRLLKQVNAKLIHTGIKGTRLYEVKNFMDTGDTEYCMLMEHPSIKGKQYIEWVEPSVGKKGNADECQAAAFGVPLEDYLSAIES